MTTGISHKQPIVEQLIVVPVNDKLIVQMEHDNLSAVNESWGMHDGHGNKEESFEYNPFVQRIITVANYECRIREGVENDKAWFEVDIRSQNKGWIVAKERYSHPREAIAQSIGRLGQRLSQRNLRWYDAFLPAVRIRVNEALEQIKQTTQAAAEVEERHLTVINPEHQQAASPAAEQQEVDATHKFPAMVVLPIDVHAPMIVDECLQSAILTDSPAASKKRSSGKLLASGLSALSHSDDDSNKRSKVYVVEASDIGAKTSDCQTADPKPEPKFEDGGDADSLFDFSIPDSGECPALSVASILAFKYAQRFSTDRNGNNHMMYYQMKKELTEDSCFWLRNGIS